MEYQQGQAGPSQQEPSSSSLWTDIQQYEMYIAMLGLAESLRNQGQPQGTYKCLMGILRLNLPYDTSARIHCELGKLLLRQTSNQDLAKQYLDKTISLSENGAAGSALEDCKLDAASALAELCVLQNNVSQARDILHSAIEQSQHSPYWQCNFIFQLAKVFLYGLDYPVATQILTLGESFSARHQAQYLTVLFQLTRAHVQLKARQHQPALLILQEVGGQIDGGTLNQMNPLLREELRFFVLSLEGLCRLSLGQAKSVRPFVQALQTSLDTIGQLRTSMNVTAEHSQSVVASNPLEMFAIAPASLLPILTYSLSAQFFGMIGYHDKLDRIFQRSILYLNGLDRIQISPLQNALRLTLCQQIIPASLTTGRYSQALQEASNFVSLCVKDSQTLASRRCQIHTILGLCALQFGFPEVADSQFNLAFRHCKSSEMMIFISLNLAMVYFRQQRFHDMATTVQRTRPDNILIENVGIRCAVILLQGVFAFVERRGLDAKAILRNGLQISNDEDLNQLMAVSLTLMGKNCLALLEYQDVVKVGKTALDLAEKIPDQGLQLLTTYIRTTIEVYGMLGDGASQSRFLSSLSTFTQRESQELNMVRQNPKLNVIQWAEENR